MKAIVRGLVLGALVAATVLGCSSKKETDAYKPPVGGGDIAIRVTDHGFVPSKIEVPKGSNATLVFTRESEQTCAKDVVIAGSGVHVDLPLNQPVRIAVGSVNDTIPFACGMDMVKGEIYAAR